MSGNFHVAIMQPYFLPYIAYFQLISAVNVFVVYDNIEYTKKGWINRNRFLQNGEGAIFTLPLKKDSDYLQVVQRKLADDFDKEKLLRKLVAAYKRAPYFSATLPVLEEVILNPETNLFEYIYSSIKSLCSYLDIKTSIMKSSDLDIDHTLTGADKVCAICKALKATHYLNAIGGISLYSKEDFLQQQIHLNFIASQPFVYKQFDQAFVPSLSILDVLMFNSVTHVQAQIKQQYAII